MPTTTNIMSRGHPNSNSNPNPLSQQHFHSTSSLSATSSNTVSTISVSNPRDAKCDVFLDASGETENTPCLQEELDFDWTRSDRLKRMGYLRDANAAVDVEFDPSQALPRAGERGIPRSGRKEVTLPSTATTITTPTVATIHSPFRSRSASKGHRAGDISTSTTVQDGGTIEWLSKSRPPPHPRTFWETELATQREIEDDDYAWYYCNPHRHIWRPRNLSASMRLRVYSRRRRIMYGGVDVEEGLPTKMNRMLFVQYIARHHREMSVGTFEAEVVEEKLKEVVKVGQETGAKKSQAGMQPTTGDDDVLVNINDDVTLLPMEDWQEELFSPKYSHRRFRRASRASSVETYTSSNHSSSSAPSSSPRISYEMGADGQGSWIADFPRGGGSYSSKKTCFNPSSGERAVGLPQFSFLRVIST